MENKGFTLVELLAVIVILALLGGIGTIAYINIIKSSEERVYMAYEDTMYSETLSLISKPGTKLPTYGNPKRYSINEIKIDPINNPRNKNDLCPSSYVQVSRDTVGTDSFKFHVCLICDDYNVDESKCKDYPKENKDYNQSVGTEFYVDFPTCPTAYYNGSTQVLFNANTSGKYTNSILQAKDVGTYRVTLTTTGKYVWRDTGTSGSRSLSCVIKNQKANISVSRNVSLTYPESKNLSISTNSGGAITCSTSNYIRCTYSDGYLQLTTLPNTRDGSSSITATVGETSNYSSNSVTITVNYSRANISCPSGNNSYLYTGSSINSGYSCPSGSALSGSSSGVNPGTYRHTCIANSGYKFNDGSNQCVRTWTIKEAKCSATCKCTCKNSNQLANVNATGSITCSSMTSTCTSRCRSICSSYGGMKSSTVSSCNCTA